MAASAYAKLARLLLPHLLVTVLAACVPRVAAGAVLDFEGLAEGSTIDDSALPAGFSILVRNNLLGHPNTAVVFDSSCTGGCSGDDEDLQTPGTGPDNDLPQGHVMIIAQDLIDTDPADGLVDDPDDETRGGSIRFFFSEPVTLLSVRVLDVDLDEKLGFVQVALTSGALVTLPLVPKGDSSAQTIVFEEPSATSSLRVFLDGSGAIDDINFERSAPTSTTTSSSTVTTTQPSSTSVTTAAVSTTLARDGVCGDVNGDGHVTARDAQQVLRGVVDALIACPPVACDVDASGSVDTTDALATLRLAVGLHDASVCVP